MVSKSPLANDKSLSFSIMLVMKVPPRCKHGRTFLQKAFITRFSRREMRLRRSRKYPATVRPDASSISSSESKKDAPELANPTDVVFPTPIIRPVQRPAVWRRVCFLWGFLRSR